MNRPRFESEILVFELTDLELMGDFQSSVGSQQQVVISCHHVVKRDVPGARFVLVEQSV